MIYNSRSKSAGTVKQGIQLSKHTVFQMVLVGVGLIGMVVFGYLMQISLAPIREASGAASAKGFNSFSDNFIIPAFLLSVYMVGYGMYKLFKAYKHINDPNTYGNKSRRSSRFDQGRI